MDLKNILKRNGEEGTDWIGWSVIVAAAVLVFGLLSAEIFAFVEDNSAMRARQEEVDKAMQFKYNVQNSESTPHEAYEDLRQALIDEDVEAAIEAIHPAYRYKYEDGLRKAAEEGRLSEAVERLTPLKEKVYDDGFATVVYETEPIPGNDKSDNPLEGYNESVEFTRTSKGYWKISSI